MFKIIGGILVIAGFGGITYSRYMEGRKRIEFLTSLEMLMYKGLFVLLGQQQNVIVFFKTVETGNDLINTILCNIGSDLESHKYSNGLMAWRQNLVKILNILNFKAEIIKTLCDLGNAFFEKSPEEIRESLNRNIKLIGLIKENEIKRQAETKKVWLPVSMLGGAIFVLLFL